VQAQFHSLERHGASFISQLSGAIKEESWTLRLLALAWTAGPVTYVALYVGFMLGYGKAPPKELFIYFGAYTVISGLITILVKIFHNATVTARKKAVARMITEVITKIPDLIIAIRNLGVLELTPERRRLRGVTYLLSDPDATESSIETAIEDLSGSREMARRFRRLESFRKKGLSILVREEAELIGQSFAQEILAISEKSGYITSLVQNRLAGRTPSKRFGQRRQYGFIQRIIQAVNSGNEVNIELIDTMEMFKLILELLMDREFTVLRWKLSGSHPVVSASKKLEHVIARRRRLERRIRRYKYRVIQLLDESIIQKKSNSAILSSNDTYPFTMAAMPDLDSPETFLPRKGKFFDDLADCLVKIKETNREIEKLNIKEEKAVAKFHHDRQQYALSIPPYEDDEGERSSPVAIRFERSSIRFSHEDKIHFAEHLHHYLANLTSNRDRTNVFTGGSGDEAQDENRSITTEELQAIALRIFAELENILDLGQEWVINALEASTAINVSAIEHGLSRRTKIGWLQAIVEEMVETDSAVALRTASRLVDHFQCPMPKHVAQILSSRFKVPIEDLIKLQPTEDPQK